MVEVVLREGFGERLLVSDECAMLGRFHLGSNKSDGGGKLKSYGVLFGSCLVLTCDIDVVDHRTLIFDKPDTNVPRAFINGAKAPPGGKKYRDQRFVIHHPSSL